MKISSLILLCFFISASGHVHAKSKNPCKQERVKNLIAAIDKNDNGQVSFQEFKAHTINEDNIKKRFKRLDKNENGVLERKEVAQLVKAKRDKHKHR